MGSLFSRGHSAPIEPASGPEKGPARSIASPPATTSSEKSREDFNQVPGIQNAQEVVIIGAGASGLAALKVITDTPQVRQGLWNVVLYESREDVGGVW
jgi:hypothetical protein